jgi:hypothetical protein
MSLVTAVCCLVEVSATGRSPVKRSQSTARACQRVWPGLTIHIQWVDRRGRKKKYRIKFLSDELDFRHYAVLPMQISNFPFTWPCIVTDFFLIKPTDALSSQIYFCQETLHVSGSFSAHHQEFSTVHSALVYVIKLQFHPGRAWKLSSNLYDIYQCRIYSGKLLMMDRETARNM